MLPIELVFASPTLISISELFTSEPTVPIKPPTFAEFAFAYMLMLFVNIPSTETRFAATFPTNPPAERLPLESRIKFPLIFVDPATLTMPEENPTIPPNASSSFPLTENP